MNLTGFEHLIIWLNRLPLIGRFAVSFFPEWRRRRVEDHLYMRRMAPLTDQINAEFERLPGLSAGELCRKAQEFRERLRAGLRERLAPHLDELRSRLDAPGKAEEETEALVKRVGEADFDHLVWRQLKTLEDGGQFADRLKAFEREILDELAPEAFAVVKEACRRHVGTHWEAAGSEITWDMVPFDVQLAGALELHRGKVVEMATGEGKTLVALMPLYLNALAGLGAHLVTVNDYLARRDSEWMGRILEYLGLTVGCLDTTDPGTPERREAYACDVTYGTNNEFGFDYLRDNMALVKEAVVQRGHHFAIIDEVDSILIDEARTPLIISGPVDRSTHQFDRLKPLVQGVVRQQNQLIGEIATEAADLLERGEEEAAGERLMWCMRGAPKHPRVTKFFQEPRHKKLAMDALDRYTTDKRLPELDEILLFNIDERGHTCDLTEKGRRAMVPNNPEMFVLFDLVDEIAQIDAAESDAAKSAALKGEARRRHEERSEELHNISQLLRAYMLYEQDVEYVVQDNRVIIVDEFTGRLMVGRRWSDGLHQAVEAKEGVKIERETQTLATITIQNYFRMCDKLAGMTGTAETEAGEFEHTYQMPVQRIPTNRPLRREDSNDVIYRTVREKYGAIIEEIEYLHGHGQPILVGTTSVEASETVARALKRKKIPANVLNAKQHQSEAEIITQAGQVGAVTIATNMAGRGTDIKLGPGVLRCKCQTFDGRHCPACPWREDGAEVDDDLPPCGLQVVGSERHESRRIDRQLRGRSGRQGDPGSSRFFLSLEDNLMRLFGSERIANILTKWGGMKEGEDIQHPLITRQIGKAQSKVEGVNFDRRKRTLEYDDVMNRQRDVIYGRRARALFATPGECRPLVLDICADAIEEAFATEHSGTDDASEPFDVRGFVEWIQRSVPYVDLSALAKESPTERANPAALESWRDDFLLRAMRRIAEAYDVKAELLGPEITLRLTQLVVLKTIDQDWRDHLLAMDELREGIGLRGYAQVNPLHEYQKEAYASFQDLIGNVNRELLERWFRLQVVQQRPPEAGGVGRMTTGRGAMPGAMPPPESGSEAPPQGLPAAAAAAGGRRVRPQPFRRDQPKVKPNDPCPCGSGKKYKKCHGQM